MGRVPEQAILLTERGPNADLGMDADPELGFAGVRALWALAEFCEIYQVRRLSQARHSWARIAAWAGVSVQAVHKGHAQNPEQPPPPDRLGDTRAQGSMDAGDSFRPHPSRRPA
jgi:hypothetical protein